MQVELKEQGRLDKVLANALNVSRNQVEQLIKKNGVLIDNAHIFKPSFQVLSPMSVFFEQIQQEQTTDLAVDFEVEIVYEDDDLLVVNKQPHLVVHPAPSVKEATLVDWLKKQNKQLSTLCGELRPGIVHRIDKETSGALVIAKNDFTHQELSKQLQSKQMGRYYLAIVTPPLKEDIVVDKPIARNPKNRLKMAIVDGGRESKSAFKVLTTGTYDQLQLIACKLFTGRTHQIRVHLSSINRAIVGDDLYGFKSNKDTIKRVMLHAYLLYLEHPRTKQTLQIQAPLFDDFKDILKQRFDTKVVNEKIDPNSIVCGFDSVDEWL